MVHVLVKRMHSRLATHPMKTIHPFPRTQGHVRVGTETVTNPAFHVTRNMEDFVTWVDTSKIKRKVLMWVAPGLEVQVQCIPAGAAAWHTGLEGCTSASVLLSFHGPDGELSLLSHAACCRYNDKLDDYDLLN